MKIEFSLVDSESGFLALKEEWERLEEISGCCDTPSSSFKWCREWWNTFKGKENNRFGRNKRLRIVCGRCDGEVVLIAPMMLLDRKVGVVRATFLEFLGQQWGPISCSVLFRPDHRLSFPQLLDYIERTIRYDILYLRQIPDARKEYYGDCRVCGGCPLIHMRKYEGYDDYTKAVYSKSLKQNMRTARNKAVKSGLVLETRVEQYSEANFAEIRRLSKAKLADNKQSIYLDEDMAEFYRLVLSEFRSDIVFVLINGIQVAYRANVLFGGTKFCIDASFDREYKKNDLGILSVDGSVRDSFDQGLEIHNEGPGLDDYKYKFATTTEWLSHYHRMGNRFLSFLMYLPFAWWLNRTRVIEAGDARRSSSEGTGRE